MDTLPIHDVRDDITDTLKTASRLILQAPTGSGKSTQLPQFLLDAGLLGETGQIIILQPRRVAARMLAKRIAHERSVSLGSEVGYQIRFDNLSSPQTRIKFVTEGILLRQILDNPTLPGIAAVVFDEFHERNLYTDLTLALARKTQAEHRPDLKLIIMSATLDAKPLENYLAPCATIQTQGRLFPVKIDYTNTRSTNAIWDKAAAQAARLARTSDSGDILIFMPGAREIHRTLRALETEKLGRTFELMPLYGELSASLQDRALESSSRRKIIVATNIAETSLTIPGVTTVIDSGLARVNRYDPHRGLNSLLVENICKSSAEQRAGRAGRLGPGQCIRLWSLQDQLYRAERIAPEIHRVDLSDTLLLLKASGIENLDTLPWFEPPRAPLVEHAESLLRSIGALDTSGHITETGRRMAMFPMHPRYARLLLQGARFDCVSEICEAVAIAEERRLLLPLNDRRREEAREEMLATSDTSDFFPAMAALRLAREKGFEKAFCEQWGIHAQAARRADQSANQYRRIAEKQGLPLTSLQAPEADVRRCLMAGFIDHLAQRTDRATLHCRMLGGKTGELRRESCIRKTELFVATEVEERDIAGTVKLSLGLATAIELTWLKEDFPDAFQTCTESLFDDNLRRVVTREELRFRDLVLDKRNRDEVPEEEAAQLLAAKILDGTLSLKHWDSEAEYFIARVNFAANATPDYGIRKMDTEGKRLILEQCCLGARSYKDIKDLDPMPALRQWLSHEQLLTLENIAPETWDLPRRRKPAKLRYEDNGVVLAATIQELYDIPGKNLRIAEGRVPLTLEILAPNRRPIQITQDLDGFWERSYPGIKKDLKGRYPKHEWR